MEDTDTFVTFVNDQARARKFSQSTVFHNDRLLEAHTADRHQQRRHSESGQMDRNPSHAVDVQFSVIPILA
ncbi:hypothetical protein RvY_05112 [Ramazzottius varieornatus]|uniref:Uncharacterized protein n=1 Tax=Ramazzottius varieornatus TaxID=947166 RepID=A0A1D1UTX3_RAMVA|nr:hypothetical protein RvY_05112 [Ramazzottius varieornatus]